MGVAKWLLGEESPLNTAGKIILFPFIIVIAIVSFFIDPLFKKEK